MNKFVTRMLELGAELDKEVSPIKISMVINDAVILYKNHIEQLNIPSVVSTSCDLSKEQLKRKIQMADMEHQIKRERT